VNLWRWRYSQIRTLQFYRKNNAAQRNQHKTQNPTNTRQIGLKHRPTGRPVGFIREGGTGMLSTWRKVVASYRRVDQRHWLQLSPFHSTSRSDQLVKHTSDWQRSIVRPISHLWQLAQSTRHASAPASCIDESTDGRTLADAHLTSELTCTCTVTQTCRTIGGSKNTLYT